MTRASSNKGTNGLAQLFSWRNRAARLAAAAAAIVAVAFAVGAYIVAPLLVDRAVRQYAANLPGRSTTVERIGINPFTLTVELNGVDLREPQAGAALSLDRVLVNFDFLTLFQRARVLDELSIEKPYLTVDLTRTEGGADVRFDEMLAAVLPAQPIRIQRFAMADGRIEIAGSAAEADRRFVLQNIAVSANDLANDSNSSGGYLLTARDAAGASLRLEGRLTVAPFLTGGRMNVQSLALETLQLWFGDRMAVTRAAGSADLAAAYSISREPDSAVVRLSGATIALSAPTLELDRGAAATAAEAGLHGDAELTLSGGVWSASGNGGFDVTDISIRDADGELLFASAHAAASGVAMPPAGLDAAGPRMSIAALELRRPQTRIFVGADDFAGSDDTDVPRTGAIVSYPLSGLLSLDASRTDGIPVQRLELIDAQIDIVDRGVSPPVLLRSAAVNGSVRRAAREDEGLLVELEGSVGESGSGRIVARATRQGDDSERDVELTARRIEAAALSPRFEKSSGRGLKEGLLDFDIEYRLRGAELEGHARIAALDLTFADTRAVDGLRWDLAAALLTDESGRLEVEAPLSAAQVGNDLRTRDAADGIDGPEALDATEAPASDDADALVATASEDEAVDQGGIDTIVVSALAGLASRVTAAPFDVLGTLAGREADALDSISFEPGAAAPSGEGLEALEDLSLALARRPRLGLLIAGRADPELDRDALAAQQIELHVTLATAGPTLVARPKPVDFASPRAWDVLDEFATERLSEEQLATIASYFPLGADGQVVAAEKPSYYRALFDALVANEPIPQNALNRLGRYRAQSIADALADFDIDPDRTRVLATRVTADARAHSLPPRPGAEQLPASGVGVPSLADDNGSRDPQDDLVLDVPEAIAVPLELQALANLEAEAGLAANADDAAAE